MFHGPGESTGSLALWAIDRFQCAEGSAQGDHYWVTQWERASGDRVGSDRETQAAVTDAILAEIRDFLTNRDARSATWLGRPEQGVPSEPRTLLGQPPSGRFVAREGASRFAIQLLGARHPGLFLDHLPLRNWLGSSAQGWRVLNTFAYTGSLSVACGLGGAAHVTTLDLSKPTIDWAQENWRLNGLADDRARFIAGDVFEWLPRLAREGERSGRRYDCVILDPPSFSRGHKGTFSTQKDLVRLHELALDLVTEGGHLVTSINSAQITWAKYEADVQAAARARKASLQILARVDLPETFPTALGRTEDRYLKGWVLRKV